MFDEEVIDSLKVTRAALESAASIAALLITTETAIVEPLDTSRDRRALADVLAAYIRSQTQARRQ